MEHGGKLLRGILHLGEEVVEALDLGANLDLRQRELAAAVLAASVDASEVVAAGALSAAGAAASGALDSSLSEQAVSRKEVEIASASACKGMRPVADASKAIVPVA